MTWHEAANLQDANLKLAELIASDFRDFELEDLALDALPVLSTDGEQVATGLFVYPCGDVARITGVVYPPLTRLLVS